MFNLEFGGNGDTHPVTPELIKQSIETLDPTQQDFINLCIQTDPRKRPSPKELLFHPLLFEVPSLRLLATHQIVKNQNESRGKFKSYIPFFRVYGFDEPKNVSKSSHTPKVRLPHKNLI
jgi:nuclear receptor-binding protein